MPEILSIGELLDLGNSASTAGLIPYSALEYNGSGDISAISGSAIAGGVDTTIVSAIASSYVESGISGKLDASASSMFAPSGEYVFESSYSSFSGDVINNISSMSSIVSGKADQSALDNCCSAMSSVVSAKADTSALTSYVPYSALKNGPTTATVSAINTSAVYDSSAHARISTLSTSRIPYSALGYSAGTQVITSISGSAVGKPQVQSNWTETATASASYIKNKPVVKNLIAGAGISITETTAGIVISLA